MKTAESKAELYLMALESLSKAEKKVVAARLMDDQSLRQDVLDIALIRERESEPTRPFRDYLAERKKRKN